LEHDNLRAALEWTLEHAPASGLRLAGSLWRFWGQRGHLIEGRRWLGRAHERAREANIKSGTMQARALVGAGLLASFQGDHPAAAALLSSGLELYREAGDTLGIALALRALGGCLLRSGGSAAQVHAVLEESLQLACEAKDTRRIGGALVALGYLAARERDYGQAQERITDGLALFRQVGDTRSMGASLWALGWFAIEDGELVKAGRHLDEALAIARNNDNKQELASRCWGWPSWPGPREIQSRRGCS
jgi:tetratricopeptide (TPR) repeat protein